MIFKNEINITFDCTFIQKFVLVVLQDGEDDASVKDVRFSTVEGFRQMTLDDLDDFNCVP